LRRITTRIRRIHLSDEEESDSTLVPADTGSSSEEEELSNSEEDSDQEIDYFGIGIQVGEPAAELLEFTARRLEVRRQLRIANILELEHIIHQIAEIIRFYNLGRTDLWRIIFRALQLAEQLRNSILQLRQELHRHNGGTE
jgi:hypothetical protein